MAANIFGNRFYGHRDAAWHGLGLVTQENMTACETFDALGGYWFETRPVKVFMNHADVETGDFAIIRSPVPDDAIERNFGYITERYKIIQPLSIVEMFDEFVSQPVETLGMLGNGEKLFITWKLNPFTVGKDDVVNPYGFVACGFDGKYGSSLNVVVTRVVCQNTWRSAIYEAENNKTQGMGKLWSGKHTSTDLEKEMAIWMGYVQAESEKRNKEIQEVYNAMDKIAIDDKQAEDLVNQIFPYPVGVPSFYPDELRKKKEDKIQHDMEMADKNRSGVLALFGGAGTSINATSWGLFNGVVEWANYGLDSKKPTQNSVLFGSRDAMMNRAFNVINKNYLS
jgi:phage/plasmid-like protein (TIGR03299 family)